MLIRYFDTKGNMLSARISRLCDAAACPHCQQNEALNVNIEGVLHKRPHLEAVVNEWLDRGIIA